MELKLDVEEEEKPTASPEDIDEDVEGLEDVPEEETEDTRRRDELLQAAAFELEQQLQISTTDINEEKASRLMDLLRVQFMDIMKSLDALRLNRDRLQIDMQSERVRQWLGSLNRSTFVPLSFRIKYLRMLEDYVDLIARDMGSLIMRAYKIGIVLIRNKARKKPALYASMVYVTGIAVHLSIQSLKRDYSHHLPPSPLDVRQTFEMARLGLTIARTVDKEQCKKDVERIQQAMIEYEILRRVDIFRLTPKERDVFYKRLPEFSQYARIQFVRAGDPVMNTKGKKAWLVSRLDQPHMKPRQSSRLSGIEGYNVFLIEGDRLIKRVSELISYSPTKDGKSKEKSEKEIHLEHVYAELLLCSQLLLRSFKKTPRAERQLLKDKGKNLYARKALVLSEEFYVKDPYEYFNIWKVIDLSQQGICLEARQEPFPVASLVEIRFSANSSRYGIVRWYRNTLQGVVQCGIEFAPAKLFPAKVGLLSSSTAESTWLALLEKVPSGWNVWIGDWTGTPVQMTVAIKRKGQNRIICVIVPEGTVGDNFAIFRIAKVMSEEEYHMVSVEEARKAREKKLREQQD